MRAVRPPPPSEASKPSWWVVVSAATWLALKVGIRQKRCELLLRQVSRGPAQAVSGRESKCGARVSWRMRLGPPSRRLYTRKVGVDRAAACLAFWRRLGRVRLGGRLGHKSRWFWLAERGEARPNERMQLTWLIGAPIRPGSAH